MPDYQEILNFLTQYMYVIAPISVIFVLVEKTSNMLISFIRGDRRVKL